jgi:hypothetical protein
MPVEAFKVPVLIALPIALLNAKPDVVIAVVFTFVACIDAEVMPVEAFNVPVDMALPIAFVN